MRINFRIITNIPLTTFRLTHFLMLSFTQTLEGITSRIVDDPQNRQYVFLDLENCTLEQAQETVRSLQQNYSLSDFYLMSDLERSYRAWCFTPVDYKTLLHILVDCLDILDYNFFFYTVKRRKATLRTSAKKGRPEQKLVSVLKTYPMPLPSRVERVIYDTGLEKQGLSLLLGERE
jgi:hypothetical protein